jgi:hypothetical protein
MGRLPSTLKILKGTANVTRLNKKEPKVQVCDPSSPPADLLPTQRLAWVELAKAVSHLRVISEADMPAFRLVVGMLAEVYDLERSKRSSSNQRVNARRAALVSLGIFGMTPADRQRVATLDGKEEADPLASYFGNKKAGS